MNEFFVKREMDGTMRRCVVVPEDAQVAVVLLHLIEEALAEEVCLVLVEIHIILVV